jgi:hypothetical protein
VTAAGNLNRRPKPHTYRATALSVATHNNILQIRTILFCPTANSAANPIFQTLKSLQEDDIILNYSDDILLDKIEEISIEKQEIEDYNKYLKLWKKFEKLEDIEKLRR